MNFCNSSPNFIFPIQYSQPYVLKTNDMLRLANLWRTLVDEMRAVDQSWQLEMYAAIIAARRLDIAFTVEESMIANAEDDAEPWDIAMWGASSTPEIGKLDSSATLQVAHYCQSYSIESSTFHWYKHDYHGLDIRKCDPLNNSFTTPSSNDLRLMAENRGEDLESKAARNVWLLDSTMAVAREAIESYYAEFCTSSNEIVVEDEASSPPSMSDFRSSLAAASLPKRRELSIPSEPTPLGRATSGVIESFVIGSHESRFKDFVQANHGSEGEFHWVHEENGWDQRVADEWVGLAGGPALDVSTYKQFEKDQFGPHAAGETEADTSPESFAFVYT